MRVSKNVAAFMILIVLLAALFFACTKKARLTALVSGATITNVASSAGSTNATITWTTNVIASSQVFYRTTSGSFTSTTEQDVTTKVKTHSVIISGLTASTRYFYYVSSKDVSGLTSTTEESLSDFITTAAGPVISAVLATPSSTSCTVTWTTSVVATSQVFYGLTNSFGTNSTATNTYTSVYHSVLLTALTAGTKYYYRVESKDTAGNASSFGDDGSLFFTTTSTPPPPTMYLLIDDIKIVGTSGSPTTRQIYLNTLDPAQNIITSGGSTGNNNVAYMCANQPATPDGWLLVFPEDPNFAYTADPSPATGSTQCWRSAYITTSQSWAGMLVLASGYFRAQWPSVSPTPYVNSLTGPTGAVALKCYMKVTGVTSAKVKFGIGETSGESISVGQSTQKTAVVTVDNTWQQFSLDLTGQNLSSINGLFLWVVGTAPDLGFTY
ncbi:MAG: fibronectin type III domain-containing protein [Elusimicrobia bacterium]|nr:fibronectin type III domain-containing protein [Elusimicrobiota bacterium]